MKIGVLFFFCPRGQNSFEDGQGMHESVPAELVDLLFWSVSFPTVRCLSCGVPASGAKRNKRYSNSSGPLGFPPTTTPSRAIAAYCVFGDLPHNAKMHSTSKREA